MAVPLISFIVTYHNEPEALVRACIESIQTLHLAKDEAEIILVDDGSKVPLCLPQREEEPQDSWIPQNPSALLTCGTKFNIQIVRQEQAGLSVARNTGLCHAQGRYIQFVDADDCLIPSAYAVVLEQLRNASPDLVLFRMTKQLPHKSSSMGSSQDKPLPIVGTVSWRGTGASFLLHHNLRASACAYVFRRYILGDLHFCPGIFHEDELFTPQLFLRANTLVELDVHAYFYRQHEGTITHSHSPQEVQKRLDDIQYIIRELKSLDEPLLERRIHQLTVDYLQKTWTLTHSFRELRKRCSELRKERFLPLPLLCYSPRYLLVAIAAKFF